MKPRILVVEDEELKRLTVEDALRGAGYEVRGAGDGSEGLRLALAEDWDLVLLDLKLPGIEGLEILKRVRAERPSTTVMMMTAYASVQTAVEAMKIGAWDYLTKPFTTDELLLRLGHLFDHRRKSDENVRLRAALDSEYSFHSIVGRSRQMRRVLDQVLMVADSDAAVLILGETGTGKELVAEAIHYSSARRQGPLVKVSCVALPETLIESELFGHERGAFSGAVRAKAGRFELARGGTVFLDDIDDVPVPIQPKLLRVLQSREFERLGGEQTVKADVRVVAATKADLRGLIAAGKFREDLYYRLHTVTIKLPPLRERRDEIPALVEHFVQRYDRTSGTDTNRRFSDEALEALRRYSWPGNIRELEHVVEAALVLTRDPVIKPSHLPPEFVEKVALARPGRVLREEMATAEREAIVRVLGQFNGNISHAAKHLGTARSTLRDRLKKLGIAPKQR